MFPPKYNRYWIGQIWMQWSYDFLTERLEKFKDKLPMNKTFSLKYLAKILGAKMYEPKPKKRVSIILD